MKIFDCFMYFDEEIILDLRLNILNRYVDYFVIVESTFNHNGKKRKLLFDKNKFKKFDKKIIYLIYEEIPSKIVSIDQDDSENIKEDKYIMNAVYRENGQRNFIEQGLKQAEDEDLILVSDVDEIPKLENLEINKIKNKIISFKQDMFYYKLNLALPNFKWAGTKGVKKKNFIGAQWLRNIKDRKYPFYRLDTFLSKKKYMNIEMINDGGWHFSNIKSPKLIEHKLKSYLHHHEFDQVSLTVNEIENLVKNKKAIYDLNVDQRVNKVGNGAILQNFEIKKLPNFIQDNLNAYKDWLD